jgi:ferredoxin
LKICPVGLIQDILPSWKKVKHSKINLYTFISFFIISVFDIAILAIIDPLITFNRLVVVFGMTSEAIVIFLMPITIIIALNFYTKRFWCFKLCPLGALVDWITIFKSKKMIDLDKRKTLIALGSGFVFGTIFRAIEPLSKRPSKRLLRPPGAIPENDFQDRCIRCGSCIAVCLTKTLTPSFFESGFNGIFTPKLVPQNAECDEYCNKCTTACPTQAIKNLPLNVKRNFKIGTASIAQDRCIAWHDNRLCLICQEYCPYLAIKSVKNEYGIPSPIVINDKCRGCGYCEKNCPARPGRAIEVFNTGAGIFIK